MAIGAYSALQGRLGSACLGCDGLPRPAIHPPHRRGPNQASVVVIRNLRGPYTPPTSGPNQASVMFVLGGACMAGGTIGLYRDWLVLLVSSTRTPRPRRHRGDLKSSSRRRAELSIGSLQGGG